MHLIGLLVACSPLLTGGQQDIESIHVVFAEEHSHDFVSSFGHIFVVLPEAKIGEVDDLLGATALNFGADTGPQGRGMWVGKYSVGPCHELIRKNAHFDQRRLTIFELDISEEELELLRSDLDARLTQTYPYDFFRHNCGHYIWDWLDGPADSAPPALYLTPREALERILTAFPPRETRTIPSRLEVLEGHLSGRADDAQGLVREALRDSSKIEDIPDLETRLLAIAVSESRAGRDDFASLQAMRSDILGEPGGAEAARAAIEMRSALTLGPLSRWPDESEGPALSLSVVKSDGDGPHSIRVMAEAGLRDPFTAPRPENVLRDTRFFTTTVETDGEEVESEVIAVSFSTLRDALSLAGGTSRGITAGYTELPSALDSRGLFLSTWAGLTARCRYGWLGVRMSLTVDELHDSPSTTLAPGLSWDLLKEDYAAHLEIHECGGETPGVSMRYDRILSESAVWRTEWTRTPGRLDALIFGFRLRF